MQQQPTKPNPDALDNASKLKEWRYLLLPGVFSVCIWLVPVALKPVFSTLFLLCIPLVWALPSLRNLPGGAVYKLPLITTTLACVLLVWLDAIVGTTLSLAGVLLLYFLERRAQMLPPALLKLRHKVTSRLVICYLIVFAYLLNPYF